MAALVLVALAVPCLAADAPFRRCDANQSGIVDLSDAVKTFGVLFLGDPTPRCLDAVDSNDSGVLDLSDGIFTLSFLYLGGPAPPAPGVSTCGPDPTSDPLGCVLYAVPGCGGPVDIDPRRMGHVLNRLGYGPTQDSIDRLQVTGLSAYIEEQLQPEGIDESSNLELVTREDALFTEVPRNDDRRLIAVGETWRYFKGGVEPPAAWKTTGFEDPSWLSGPTGIGYGDGDDATSLDDMEGNYISVYLRRVFPVSTPAAVRDLILRVDYDDGFVAYLNGTEVARRGLSGNPPLHDAVATSHEAGEPVEIDISARKGLLVEGSNVLAIQVHNSGLGSGDLSMIPELIDRQVLPGPPLRVIRGTAELQELVHVRGIYSRRQLQAVLGEFWENHLTTDVEKVAEYLNELQNSDASDAMSDAQARREAAQLEYEEYQFFHDNALGNFGDLLLYSATSPSMLIYLDSVKNVKGAANENYPREIFELHAFGVDNRYTQKDIEELSKCFTGWSICKIDRDSAPAFPERALDPPSECGVRFADSEIVALGSGWRYFKGRSEPTPAAPGVPGTDWTLPAFDASAWTSGSTGIGYGDGDDATVLADMRNSYATVYLRRTFNVPDPAALKNFIFEVTYDDGYVAYLNGVEVARSESMGGTGSPPPFDALAREGREVSEGPELHNWNKYRYLLVPGQNVLAIQVHNSSLGSSDLSMLPRVLDREILPGSIENGDPDGAWTFRFLPEFHDTSAKVLFQGTPYQRNIPAGRVGQAGLADALDVVTDMVNHPSTAEFICIKLVQRFVSDDITLATYKEGTAPPALVDLVDDAIAAWNSTTPRGNIRTVLRAIFDPSGLESEFWAERNFAAKVKTPVEFINSTVRVLEGSVTGTRLRQGNEGMGMAFFTRDEPDGWSELGVRWIDTASMLARITFAQRLAENQEASLMSWSATEYLSARGISTAAQIVDHFDALMFQGTLLPAEETLLRQFLETDDSYNALPLTPGSPSYETRVEQFVGLLLSLPRWQYQ